MTVAMRSRDPRELAPGRTTDTSAPSRRDPRRARGGRKPSRLSTRQVAALRVATAMVIIAGWWLAAHFAVVPPLFLPAPEAILAQLISIAHDGFADATLAEHVLASLGRVFTALAFAILLGVPAGLAIGLSRVARGILDPIIEFIRPIPPLAYLPLIVIWCGIGELTKVLVIFIAVFAPVAIASAAGVASVPADRIDAGRALGATRLQLVTHVILPNALPSVLTGLRIGLGVGWSTLVAAELVAATRGLGFMVQTAAQFLETDVVLMGILMIAVIAIALDALVRFAERLLVPWAGKA